MNREKKIREEVDMTMSAFDNIESVEGNPFLFTRIKSELSAGSRQHSAGFVGILRPAILAVIIAVNIYTIAVNFSADSSTQSSGNTALTTLAQEYNLRTSNEYLPKSTGSLE